MRRAACCHGSVAGSPSSARSACSRRMRATASRRSRRYMCATAAPSRRSGCSRAEEGVWWRARGRTARGDAARKRR
eukprot:6227156-Prymnesium_polylepis.3